MINPQIVVDRTALHEAHAYSLQITLLQRSALTAHSNETPKTLLTHTFDVDYESIHLTYWSNCVSFSGSISGAKFGFIMNPWIP